MGLSKLLSRIKKLFGRESRVERVEQEQPCVLPKNTIVTDENRPPPVDERPVEVDDGRWTWKKMKRRLRWRSRRQKYSVAKAERLNRITGPFQRPTEGLQDDLFSSSEVLTSAEDQVEQDDVSGSPVKSTAHKDIDSVMSLAVDEGIDPADNDTDSTGKKTDCAVNLKAGKNPDCEVNLKAGKNPDCAVNLKAGKNPDCEVNLKHDEGSGCAVSPTANEGINSAAGPAGNGGTDCPVSPKVGVDDGAAAGPAAANNTEGAAGPAGPAGPARDDSTASVPTNVQDEENIFLQYRIGDKLGQGGFGSVHKGVRLKDGLKVAVKFAEKTACMKRIKTAFHPSSLPAEIALLLMASRNPSCPHIIQLLDWQDEPDHYVIVMEYPVQSMDMSRFMRRNGGVLKERMTQFIMWQVVYAANFCCYRGVFHRDIKLQNVLVNPNTLEVKLIDFGCGDLMKGSYYKSFCGTRQYFPPEYFEKGKYHAKPATVFSLGVLMFIILQGHFPTAYDMRLLSSVRSAFNVSKECCHLMRNCLQHRPESRICLENMQYDDWFVMEFPDPDQSTADAPQTSHQ